MDLIVPVYHQAEIFSEHMQSIQHRSEEGVRSLAWRWGFERRALRKLQT
jgi:hypothetical protein